LLNPKGSTKKSAKLKNSYQLSPREQSFIVGHCKKDSTLFPTEGTQSIKGTKHTKNIRDFKPIKVARSLLFSLYSLLREQELSLKNKKPQRLSLCEIPKAQYSQLKPRKRIKTFFGTKNKVTKVFKEQHEEKSKNLLKNAE